MDVDLVQAVLSCERYSLLRPLFGHAEQLKKKEGAFFCLAILDNVPHTTTEEDVLSDASVERIPVV
jgi:hypothetical protein